MLPVAIVTLALLSGDCPTCGPQYSQHPQYAPAYHGKAKYRPYDDPATFADSPNFRPPAPHSRHAVRYGERPLIVSPAPDPTFGPPHLPWRPRYVQLIPRPIVGCVGQNCASCDIPLYPGAVRFDYRTDFDYPWSQTPCVLPVAAAYPEYGPDGPLLEPAGDAPEEVITPVPEARNRTKGKITRRPASVVVSDLPRVPKAR